MDPKWTVLLAALTIALAGCSDDGGSDDADPSSSSSSTSGSQSQTGTGMDGEPEPPAYVPRYENGTITDIASCSAVSAAVAAGAPADPAAQVATIALNADDGGHSYAVTLVEDAFAPAGTTFPAASLCVGFDGVGSLSGASGTVPEAATEMYIGGDAVFQGAYSVYFS